MLRSLAFVALLMAVVAAHGQSFKRWSKHLDFGASSDEVAKQLIAAPEGGFYAVGEAAGGSVLVMYSQNGALLWRSYVPGIFPNVIATADGPVVATSVDRNKFSTTYEIGVHKFDEQGKLKWRQFLPFLLFFGDDYPGIGADAAGNIYVCRRTRQAHPSKMTELAKLGINGSILWTRTFTPQDQNAHIQDIAVSADGVTTLVGYIPTTPYYDPYEILKLQYDSSGNLLMADEVGLGYYKRAVNGPQGSQFILLSYHYDSPSKDVLQKFDSTGLLVWDVELQYTHSPFYPIGSQDYSDRLKPLPNGGAALLGKYEDSYSLILIKFQGSYLTRDKFVEVYDYISDYLHSSNPFQPQPNYDELRALIPEWVRDIKALLSHHQAQLTNLDQQVWVLMRGNEDGKVHAHLMVSVDSIERLLKKE